VINGKGPAVSRHVPVEFVKILEKPQLAVCLVGNGVCVHTGFEEDLLPADIDFFAVPCLFDMIRFPMAVPKDIHHLETHFHGVSVPVLISGGELPDNAPLDHPSCTDHADGFCDGHVPGLMHANPAFEIKDLLGPDGRSAPHSAKYEKEADERGNGYNTSSAHYSSSTIVFSSKSALGGCPKT